MKLVLPSKKYRKTFLEYIKELRAENDPKYTKEASVTAETFDGYVNYLLANRFGEKLEDGHVPATTYWLIDNDEIIGRFQIRHELNEFLSRFGGHLGYLIRPSKRKMGYGSKILELGIKKAKKLGIKKALITCDKENVASRKIIEKNGGIFEKELDQPDENKIKLRYWIEIK